MAKSKYDPETFPLLAGGFARDGLTDKQIAERLGISQETFYQYKKRFPEFTDTLKANKAIVDAKVENALLKRALGYQYEEKQTTIKNGKVVEVRTITKEVTPDTTAQIFWLKNRKPETWREKQTIQVDYEKLSDDDLTKVITGIVQTNEATE